MKRRLAILFFLFFLLICGVKTGSATTISGSLTTPGSVGVTGTLYLSLSQQASQLSGGSCGGPFVVVPTIPVVIAVTAGTVPSTSIVGNDCLAPANTYYVAVFRDSNGNLVFNVNWQITGTTLNVGAIIPLIVPSGTASIGTAYVTNLFISGICTINGSPCASSSGVSANALLFGVTNIPLSSTAPSTGQCLTYNGSQIVGSTCGSVTGSGAAGELTGWTGSTTLGTVGASVPWTFGLLGGSDIECQNSSGCLVIISDAASFTGNRVILQPGSVAAANTATNSGVTCAAATNGGQCTFSGATSGGVVVGVAAVAGSPNEFLYPKTTGSGNTFLTTDGGNPQQTSWDANLTDIAGALSYSGSNGISTAIYNVTNSCTSSASPAACGTSAVGFVVIAAGTSSVTVDTTRVSSNSKIIAVADDTLGSTLGVTCNSTLATLVAGLAITARVPATSFDITSGATPAVNPLCISFQITD